jgi:putative membrane protein
MILQDMYDNPTFYDGKKISLRGKVMRKKSSPADECAAVRMLMTCCAADLQPVGFECRYSDAVKLDRSKWYDVHGTIRLAVIDGDTIPVIQADEFNEAAKPKTEYIYPIM